MSDQNDLIGQNTPGHIREWAALEKAVPQLFCPDCSLTILYVGAYPGHTHGAVELKAAGHHLILLEVVPKWAKKMQITGLFDRIMIGDVRKVHGRAFRQPIDAVYWRHGPEHLEFDEIEPTLERLEAVADKFVVACAPSGPTRYCQPRADRPTLHHQSVPEIVDFRGWGYKTVIVPAGSGVRRGSGAMIIAWKYKSPW